MKSLIDNPSGLILVADDEVANRELLRDLLEAQGHSVIECKDGAETLASVKEFSPDLLLLDIMMPEPDGFEICRRLKSEEVTASIPILLVTALSDRRSRIEGMEAGANDFLTKPIDTTDTVLRIRNALLIKRLHDLAQQRYERLAQLEEERQEMVDMLVHDFKSPLTAVLGYLQLLQGVTLGQLSAEQESFIEGSLQGGRRLMLMISAMLDVSRIDSQEAILDPKVTTTTELLERTLAAVKGNTQSKETKIEIEVDQDTRLVCDPDLILRVLENLCDNALQHIGLKSGLLSLRTSCSEDRVRFEVEDDGPGIPLEIIDSIFTKYATTGPTGYSQGLGLTFCRKVVELHGGTIGVANRSTGGCTFHFELPMEPLTEASKTRLSK